MATEMFIEGLFDVIVMLVIEVGVVDIGDGGGEYTMGVGGVVIIGGGDSGLLGVEVPLPKTEHPGLESRPATESATLVGR